MSESTSTPFLHWGKYKSKDQSNPDKLHFKVIDAEPKDTAYSTNIVAEVDALGVYMVPLHNFESKNKALIVEWTRLRKAGKIKDGQEVQINTWLGVSTRNADKTIRRWKLTASTS